MLSFGIASDSSKVGLSGCEDEGASREIVPSDIEFEMALDPSHRVDRDPSLNPSAGTSGMVEEGFVQSEPTHSGSFLR
jgi:hypothetical protein